MARHRWCSLCLLRIGNKVGAAACCIVLYAIELQVAVLMQPHCHEVGGTFFFEDLMTSCERFTKKGDIITFYFSLF